MGNAKIVAADKTLSWRDSNTITNWEFTKVGELLCDYAPRDLALMVVRLQGQLEAPKLIGNVEKS